MKQLFNRMLRAAKLESDLYEEVEADESSLKQAIWVVVLASLAAGIALLPEGGFGGLILGIAAALISWVVWAYLTYIIGTQVLPGENTQSDFKEMLRTLGFASAPGVIRVLGIITAIQGVVMVIANIWMLIAMVIAVRQALDYQHTWRAIFVVLIGFIIQVIIYTLINSLIG